VAEREIEHTGEGDWRDCKLRWEGVDLDGTLAVGCHPYTPGVIGDPVTIWVDRVNEWLLQGVEVRIFTGRASTIGKSQKQHRADIYAIKRFCRTHFGKELPITCKKDCLLHRIWDNQARQVETDTGREIKDGILRGWRGIVVIVLEVAVLLSGFSWWMSAT